MPKKLCIWLSPDPPNEMDTFVGKGLYLGMSRFARVSRFPLSAPFPFHFFFRTDSTGSTDDCLPILLRISFFLLSRFSVLHFSVVGSVLSINLTHVDFQAHVKIASRIVSYVVRYSQGLSSDAVSSYQYRKKVAHTRLPSVGLRS